MASIRVGYEDVKTLNYSSITNSYKAVGSPIQNFCRILIIQNLTDKIMMFSFDGSHDHLPLNAESSIVLDLTANKNSDRGFFFPNGQPLYVKYVDGAPTKNAVYLTALYGE